MIKKLVYTLPVLLSFAVYNATNATNAFAEVRFNSMDKDKDGFVDFEEFKIANPNFSPVAFEIVDTNKDKKVTKEEWAIFLDKHNRPEGLRLEAEQITRLPAKEAPDAPQVVTPNTSVPLAPQITNTSDNFPILTPPPSQPQAPSTITPNTLQSPEAPQITTPKVEVPNAPAPLNLEQSSQLPLNFGDTNSENTDLGIMTPNETAEERPVAEIPVDSEGNAISENANSEIMTPNETAEERPVTEIPTEISTDSDENASLKKKINQEITVSQS